MKTIEEKLELVIKAKKGFELGIRIQTSAISNHRSKIFELEHMIYCYENKLEELQEREELLKTQLTGQHPVE